MKRLLTILAIGVTPCLADVAPVCAINSEAFEPSAISFVKLSDKFAQPKQIVAYKMLWPIERNRAGSVEVADVVVLVQIDGAGYPRKLSVLSSTDNAFNLSALSGLRASRWAGTGAEQCFYFRAHFDLAAAWDTPSK